MANKSLSLSMLMLMGAILALSSSVEGCNRFCEDKDGNFKCCETPPPVPPSHPGECPEVIETYCGEIFTKRHHAGYAPPKKCKTDYECGSRHLKCCFDYCLKKTVCKPSI